MRKVLWLLAAAGCCLALFWWSQQSPEKVVTQRARPAVPITVIRIEPTDFQEELSALGTLQAWESVDISASVAQIVTAVGFEDGQQVDKGDMLALLKQDAEQASLRELQASLQDAKREVRRLENLARKNQVAQTELDRARTQQVIISHQIEEVEARIADRTIIAPFSGILGLRQFSKGALVTPGQRLTTLDDISRMRLQFNVPATLLGFLQVGQQIHARAPAFQQTFVGNIAALDSRVDPVARSIGARAVLENPESLLRPGLLMELTIKGPARQALLVPEESLESRAMAHYVWKVEGENARRTLVQIGGRVPGWVEIVQGLQAGDEVVRDGVGRLRGEQAKVARVEP